MNVAILKYNSGNVRSVDYALQRIGIKAEITGDKERLQKADKIIFPGVGEAETTMDYLRHQHLDDLIVNLKQPVLGICLGMQLLCASSEEGDVDCLGVFDVPVKRFVADASTDKIPHMGWNTLDNTKTDLLKALSHDEYVYFVHSYYVPICDYTIAGTNYIHPFSAVLHKDNFYATQFHPEKSGKVGEQILKNFIEL